MEQLNKEFRKITISKTAFFNVVMVLYTIVLAATSCVALWTKRYTDNWGISDYIINYEGGFVRRGLIGQLLYYVSDFSKLDPRILIYIISLATLAITLNYFIRQFRTHGIYWWMLPLCVFYGALPNNIIRKDYLMLCVILLIFYCYKHIEDGWEKLICIILLVILNLNIHEASFFMIVPFLTLLILRDKHLNVNNYSRIIAVSLMWIAFFVICLFKGNEGYVYAINESWRELFPSIFDATPGFALKSIGWTTLFAIHLHTNCNFGLGCDPQVGIFGFFIQPITICFGLYLIIFFPVFFKIKNSKVKFLDVYDFSLIVFFQFISMLPLFVCLSTDYTRLFLYLTSTSFMIAFSFGNVFVKSLFPIKYVEISKNLLNFAIRFVPPSKLLLVLIILFYGVSHASFDMDSNFQNSVVGCVAHGLTTLIIKF